MSAAKKILFGVVSLLVCVPALPGQPAVDLKALEVRGEAEFARRDCAAAARTYGEAVAATASAGSSAHPDFYYRRIGICEARVGHLEGALDAYQKGWQASELSHDDEMLAENIHGAALMLISIEDYSHPVTLREAHNADVDTIETLRHTNKHSHSPHGSVYIQARTGDTSANQSAV